MFNTLHLSAYRMSDGPYIHLYIHIQIQVDISLPHKHTLRFAQARTKNIPARPCPHRKMCVYMLCLLIPRTPIDSLKCWTGCMIRLEHAEAKDNQSQPLATLASFRMLWRIVVHTLARRCAIEMCIDAMNWQNTHTPTPWIRYTRFAHVPTQRACLCFCMHKIAGAISLYLIGSMPSESKEKPPAT